MPGSNRDSRHQSLSTSLARLADQPQIDFEIEFYYALLARIPDYSDVLLVQASNLSDKGFIREGLRIDQRLVDLRPHDPTAHYNLACRLALLKQPDLAFSVLRKAIELGYRDFGYMRADSDLDSLRKDPRFKQLLREFKHR